MTTNRRTSNRPTFGPRKATAMALIVATMTASLLSAPAALAGTQQPKPPDRSVAPPGWNPAEALANGVIAKIGGDAFELLLAQVGMGDKTSAKLDQIIDQLGKLDKHLDEMETRLQTIIDIDNFSTRVALTANDRNSIATSLKDLRHVGDQAVKVRDLNRAYEKATGKEKLALAVELARATSDYDTMVTEFKNRAADLPTHIANLHTALTADVGQAESVVKTYRRTLLDHRYLTNAYSQSLEQFYVYYEDYQSVAVMLEAERNVALYKSIDTIERLNRQLAADYQKDVTAQRAELPTPIPEQTVIDVGLHATDTRNKSMWTHDAGKGTQWWPGSTEADANGALRELARLNTTKPAGSSDWRLPNLGDMDQLFAGVGAYTASHPGKTPADYLTSLNLTGYTTAEWLWSTDFVDQSQHWHPSKWMEDNHLNFRTRLAVLVRDAPARCVRPYLGADSPSRFPDRNALVAYAEGEFRNQTSRMALIRSTGDVAYM